MITRFNYHEKTIGVRMKIFLIRTPILILFAICICIVFTTMSYGQVDPAVISVNPAALESPMIGEELTISLDITGGVNVAGYQVTVSFDPTALRFISSENGGYLPAGALTIPPLVKDDSVTVAAVAIGVSTPEEEGTLARVTFEVVSVKDSNVVLTNVILSDTNSDELPISTVDGMVTAPDSAEVFSIADVILILDSSGSMEWNALNNLQKTAAKFFIDLADHEIQIAIVDSKVETNTYAELTFADGTGKEQLKNAVDRVASDGDTDLAAGLQLGYDLLSASSSPDARKAAVLLTDGQDSGPKTASTYVQNYILQGWDVYTIGLGTEVDRNLLENIAQLTPEGDYFPASLDNMQKIYNEIFARVTRKTILFNNIGYINQNQQITKKFLIDSSVEQMVPSANWQGSTIELILVDPNGLEITSQDALTNPNIKYQDAPTYAIYSVDNPMPGEWGMKATGIDIPPEGEQYNLIVSATSDFVISFLSFEPSYLIGDRVRIGLRARTKTVQSTEPVLGAHASVEIVRPDGRIDSLALFDTAANGVYVNEYFRVDIEGTYLIRATVDNGFTREIQEQIVVGDISDIFIDGSTLTPAARTTLDASPSVISAVISGPAIQINSNTIELQVDGTTVTHGYDTVNQEVLYRSPGLSPGEHTVKLSVNNELETTWTFNIGFTEWRFELFLDPGLNVVSLPLKPRDLYTAKSFSELLDATLVVRYDSTTQTYIAYVATNDTDEGFTIEGGRGYIVNTPEPTTVDFIGTAWSNQPSSATAPNYTTETTTWAFAINSNLQMMEPDKQYTLAAKNLRTGAVVNENISTAGRSSTAVWVDMNRNNVAQSGDMIEFTISDSTGNIISGPFHQPVTNLDIRNAYMFVQMTVGDIRPSHTLLGQNYPNPFNPETWIPYQISNPTEVSILIYDHTGHIVKILELGMKPVGIYVDRSQAAYWDGTNDSGESVASGLYFYSLQTRELNVTRRMVILK